MRNLADVIENFIIGELFTGETPYILVQRNDLAAKLDCAPSQISYALSTRFTPERGFEVESKRGTGGFIRIVKIQKPVPSAEKSMASMTASDMVTTLSEKQFITVREAELMRHTLEILEGHVSEADKKEYVKEAYSRISLLQGKR